jgi:alpha-N-acetylglucosamine transferase
VPGSYNEWNYSKLRLWQQLTDYRRVVFVDADQLVLRSIDFLFDAPEVSATANCRTLFNSGVMVLDVSDNHSVAGTATCAVRIRVVYVFRSDLGVVPRVG